MDLPKSIGLPDIFHGMETYNYYGKSKTIKLPIKVHTISIPLIFNFFHADHTLCYIAVSLPVKLQL